MEYLNSCVVCSKSAALKTECCAQVYCGENCLIKNIKKHNIECNLIQANRSRSRSKSKGRRNRSRSRSRSKGRRNKSRSRSRSKGRRNRSQSRSRSKGRRNRSQSRSGKTAPKPIVPSVVPKSSPSVVP